MPKRVVHRQHVMYSNRNCPQLRQRQQQLMQPPLLRHRPLRRHRAPVVTFTWVLGAGHDVIYFHVLRDAELKPTVDTA